MKKAILELVVLAYDEGRCVEGATDDDEDRRAMGRDFEQVVQAALDGESIPYPLGDDDSLVGIYDATRQLMAAHHKARQPQPSRN